MVSVGSSYLLSPILADLLQATNQADHVRRQATLRRCDDKGCLSSEVRLNFSSLYLTGASPDAGYLIKYFAWRESKEPITYKFGDFVETATFNLGVEVSYGHCPFAEPYKP